MANKTFDLWEYDEKRRSGNTSSNTSSKESTDKVQDKFDLRAYDAYRNTSLITEKFNSWLSDYDSLAKDYSSRYTNVDTSVYRSDSADWYNKLTERTSNRNKEAQELKDIVDQYKNYLDPEWVDSFYKTLSEVSKYEKDMVSGAKQESEYWSQWEGEAHYNYDYDNYTYGTKYEGKTYADIQKALESAEGREKDWLNKNLDNFKSSSELQAEIDELRHDYDLDDPYIEQAFEHAFGDVAELLGFVKGEGTRRWARDEVTRLIQLKADAENRETKAKFEQYMPDALKWYDELNEAGITTPLNKTNELFPQAKIGTVILPNIDGRHTEFMTHFQRVLYHYLKEHPETGDADEYLKAIQTDLDKADKEQTDKWISEKLDNGNFFEKMALQAASIGGNIFGGALGYAENAYNILSGNSINPYSPSHEILNLANTIRSETAKNIEESAKWEMGGYNIASSLYSFGMSAIDSTMGGLALGNAYLILAGTTAATSKMQELYEKGATNEQILISGTLSGLAEVALEKIGLDNLLKPKASFTLLQGLKEVAKQAGIEGFEEGLTESANIFFDEIIMGNKSNISLAIKRYESGYYDEKGVWHSPISTKEATKKAYTESLGEVLYAIVGGIVSGGMSAAPVVSVQTIANSNALKNTGKSILATNGGYDALKNLANEVSSEELTKGEANIGKLVDKAQVGVDAINDGKASKRQINKTAKNVGILSEAVNSVRNEQNLAEIQSVLESKGLDSSKAKTSAELLNRLLYDNELTKAEYNALMSDERVYDTYRELVSSSQSTLKSRNTKHTLGRMGIITNADGTHSVMEIPNKKTGASDIESPEAKNAGVKSNYTVSSDGVTRMIDGEEAVEIADIVSIDGGGVTVKLSNGKKVNAADVSFASEAEAQLYSELSSYTGGNIYDIHPSIAKGIISSYDQSSDISPAEYLKAAAIAYTFGKYNIPKREIPAGLSDAQKNYIYKLGQTFAENRVKQDEERVRKQIAYSFKQYSDHQLENWKDSKTIIPYENQRQLSEFIDKSLSDNGYNKKIYFGQINDDLARRIKNEFGVSVDNYNCVLRADEVRKILKNSHGNQTNEELRGQRQIKKEDIMDIPLIIQNPDSIELSPKQFEGKPVLIFRKELHGKETVVAYVSKKHMDLTVQTMYSGKEKSHSTTPIGNNTLSHTSETLSVKAFSNNMVSQNEPSVNSNDMQENAKNTGELVIEKGVKAVHESQKIALRVLTLLAERLGLTIHVYKSDMVDGERVYTRADGTVVSGKNGWYDTKTGEIWLDINAGTTGQGLILFTASHELVHFIRQWSHAKFKILADFLMDKYGEAGKSVDDLIHQQMSSRGIEYDEAYEEVVASSMEAMLKDGKVLEKLAELEKKDHGIVQKIRTFLKNFADKLRSAYKDIDPATEEGQFFAEMTEEADRIAQLFAEALHDAGENFKKTDVSKFEMSKGVKYSTIGRNALIADELKPERWWVGNDNKDRYEISDKDMKADLNGYVENPKYVGDYVKHDQLFRAYPEIKDYRVEIRDVIGGLAYRHGSVDHKNKTIYIKRGLDNELAKEAFLHEMQHIVQYIEGFVGGTNKDSAGRALFNKVYNDIKNTPEFKTLKTAESKRKYVVHEIERRFSEYLDANGLELKPGFERNFETASIFAYLNYYGEKEARNTADKDRREMTEAQLAKNRAENDGDIYDKEIEDRKFIDNLIEIGYTESEAKKFIRFGVDSYDNQYTNADKSNMQRSTEASGEGREGMGKNGSDDGSRSDGSERGVHGERGVRGADTGAVGMGARPIDERLNTEYNHEKYSSSSTDVSTRGLLVNALESAAQTDAERKKLSQYKAKISEIEALEQRIDELVEEKRKLRADKENADAIKLREIQDEIIKTTNRIDIADKQLLRLEVAKELQNIVERQRKASYSYEKLAQKKDLKIPRINGVEESEIKRYKADKNLFAKNMRAIAASQNNAKNSETSVFLHCDDLNADIQITRDSFKHGAARMDSAYIAICSSLSDVLKNSIVVNELRNREDTNGSYVLLSLAENSESYIIVRSIVNKKTWKLEDYNELYAVRKKSIKKEDVGFKPPHYIQKNGYGTSSIISVSDFLEFVNSEKLGSGVLSDDVIEKLGHERKRDAILTSELKYSDRGGEDVSTRGLLVNALESAAQTDAERKKLSQYKAKISEIETLERKLEDISRQIRQITFGKGPKDMDKLRSLQDEKIKTTNRIDIADKQLLRLEVAKELQNIVERQRKAAYSGTSKKRNTDLYKGKKLHIDGEIYSYDFMTALNPMRVETMPPLSSVKENDKISQEKAVSLGLANAKRIGRQIASNQYVIKNAYTGREIVIGKNGLNHSLDASNIHRLRTNARLSAIGGHIVQNAVPINGLVKKNPQADGTYAMACLLNDGNGYVVAIVTVDEFSSKALSIDFSEVTHSINGRFLAKKEDSRSSTRELDLGQASASTTAISEISIADFLEIVNSTHRSLLSDDVLRHFDEARPESGYYSDKVLFSDRGGEDVSTRGLLVNALESAAQTDAERKKLSQYKSKISEIEALERRIDELVEEKRKLRADKENADAIKLREIQDEIIKTTNRIDIADKQLLRLEVAKELQNIVERQRNAAYAKAKEAAKQHRKEADERREKTLRRNQIRKTVDDLNRLLTRPTKEKHVPIWLQKPVAEFLSAIDQDNDSKIAYYDAKVKKFSEELEALQANPQADPAVIQEVKLRLANAQARGFKTVEHLRAIKAAYDKIFESKDPVISNAFHPEVSEKLEEIVSMIGQNVPLSTMSLPELDQVFQAVKIVENVVRNANKFFAEGQKQTITETAKAIDNEVLRNRQKIKERIKAVEGIKGLTFTNNLKPLTLAKMIGSDTFTALLERMIDSENTWAVDQWEAKQHYEKIADETGAKSWELEARHEVTLGGEKVSLSLGQIMSLYALSRRKQAVKHLTEGGFVDGEDQVFYKRHKLKVLELEVNALRPTRITAKELADIGKLLTDKQVEFVREMQSYLSTTMANKGNESSRAMYGIDLFGELFYFPIKSKQSFLAEEKRNADGKNRTKNLGMTKQTTPGANNPVVLSDFMNVWTKHINDMALYHSVTTVEDFSRVWHSKYAELDGGTPKTLKDTVTAVCGKNVSKYVDKLIDDANAGIRAQDRDLEKIEKLTSRTKKAAVYLSASVTIQQISAVERAKAYIPERYFLKSIFAQFEKGHKASWEEMKRYCPVAIIKEMGGYDLTGANTRQWMMGAKGTVAKIDEKLGGFPAKMDELAWCAIWEAGKNMTASLRGEHGEVLYEKGSEAFYKKASEIVTEAIRHTQVYDSIFVRSGHMRSNSQYAKALTAFMAEPTTSFNMYVESMIDFTRGGEIRTAGRKVKAKIFAIQLATGVVRASIGAALAAALIHAMRDDDEEKTFAEKYAGHAVVDVIDNLTILNMIPVVKDYFSITQGYDVARPDVQLFTDAWRACNALDSDELSSGEKIIDIVATISSFTPIPLKNLKRDAVGLYNTLFNSVPLSKTTWLGVKEAVSEEISGKEESNSDLLYEAMLGGSKKEISRIKARYDSESQVQSAIRKGLRENDPRIREAAMLNIKGDMKGYAEIVHEIASEKIFEKDRIIEAVNLEINAINRKSNVTDNEPIDEDETVTSLFNASMLNRTLDGGDTETALEMIDDMVNAKVESGKTEQEAKSAIKSNVTRYWKEKYIAAWRAGDDEEMLRIRRLLTETKLYGTAYKVSTTVRDWLKDAAGK